MADNKRKADQLEEEVAQVEDTPDVKHVEENVNGKESQEKDEAEDGQKGKDGGDVVEEEEEEDEDGIGPLPCEALPKKARRVVEFEKVYLDGLPSADAYERSYMHRDVVTHLLVSPKTDFLVTGSCDGHVKFWKKLSKGVEFVKHFRTHMGNIQDMSCNSTGTFLMTISNDKSIKIFDVVNFDMINMIKLDYAPGTCQWIHSPGDPVPLLAVSQLDSPVIRVYDGKGDNSPVHVMEKLHAAPVLIMRYNPNYSVVISADKNGMLEYWSSAQYDYKFPEHRVEFDSKMDTDLYEFAKTKVILHDIAFSDNGSHFATISNDRKVRVFKFSSGKMVRVFDESLQQLTAMQQMKQLLPNMEFGRRMAIERDLEKSEVYSYERVAFDKSGYFIVYPTVLGIKIVNWFTNKCVKMIAKGENLRALNVSLYQDIPNKPKASLSVEMKAAENPNLENAHPDPSLFCTAFKKSRFYMFTRREPEDSTEETMAIDRDVFNEKPSREDIISATETPTQDRVFENCCIHTTLGDIHCKLFVKECPKSVENFCVHAKNGYYNSHIFHRIIKQFMIQTGDPTGTGTGGESIWGTEFEDEFHPNLKHDKPYSLSMANAGPNTNGSQFFITVIPCPWLDGKHTVFGRVTQGMETAQNISNAKTNPKTDKPYDEIKIINISLK